MKENCSHVSVNVENASFFVEFLGETALFGNIFVKAVLLRVSSYSGSVGGGNAPLAVCQLL